MQPLLSRAVQILGVASALALHPPPPALGDEAPARSQAIVLELFTSQGCSSCPPADRLLSRLGEEELPGGARLIPLAFHVDYWDRIGWKDPFSAADWSARQRRYRSAFECTIYTPQLVIDGRVELVGSREATVRREIEERAAEGRDARVEITRAAVEEGIASFDVRVWVDRATDVERLDLMVAVFENGLETQVTSGENARRTLRNDHVVRRLRRVAEVPAMPGGERLYPVAVKPAAGWNRESLGVAVFLQDPQTLEIHAADAVPLE